MPETAAAFCVEVAARAGYLCEYCQTPEQESFVGPQIDHIIPLRQGGKDYAGSRLPPTHCNRRKGSDLTAFDPATPRDREQLV
jgi:hypothetical protein